MASKSNAKTILDLVEAHDVSKGKRYKKGKFLGKVKIAFWASQWKVSLLYVFRVALLIVTSL